MQATSYNRYIINKLRKPFSILLTALVIWLIVFTYSFTLNETFKRASTRDGELNKELKELQEDIQRTKEAYRVWSSSNQNKLTANGLQIEEAKKILDDLSYSYGITNLAVNASSPVVRNDYKNSLTQLQYSVISIQCSAYTDESIFNFVNALIAAMPGSLQVKSMKLSNSMSVTPEVLKGIAEGNFKDLVKAQIEIVWQEVQAIKPGG
ncbi:MAG: hypothetical protein JSS50_00125 [Proteobacteria bacterium]|nr:hypothetical protein [Pseudomonadota bacterium]